MLRAILTNKQFSINKNNSLISILNLLRVLNYYVCNVYNGIGN